MDDTRTVEEWAERKGMLPRELLVPARVGMRQGKAKKQNPRYVHFAMAKAHARWIEGQEVSEADFDKAVADSGAVGIQ